MPPFTVVRDSPLPPARAWARVTDWPQHGRWVPLTAVRVTTTTPDGGVGTVFTARTGGRRVGFDDPMEIIEWRPPGADGHGRCRIQKRGRVLHGWAELTVEPHGAGGSRTRWREEATPARAPRLTGGASRVSGRLLFGRVLRRLLDG